MEIICLRVGDLSTNCYLAVDEESGETLIIDPGDEGDFISSVLLEKKLIPKAIILTHGHYDHCLAALELKLNFSIPIYLHQKDLFLYEKAHLSSTYWTNQSSSRAKSRDLIPPKLPPIDYFLTDNQVISFGNSLLTVIHTPGHTPGSICLFSSLRAERGNPALFTGDTLFAEGVGRTNLSYSSPANLQKSLKHLHSLPKSTFIYPGHEEYGVML